MELQAPQGSWRLSGWSVPPFDFATFPDDPVPEVSRTEHGVAKNPQAGIRRWIAVQEHRPGRFEHPPHLQQAHGHHHEKTSCPCREPVPQHRWRRIRSTHSECMPRSTSRLSAVQVVRFFQLGSPIRSASRRATSGTPSGIRVPLSSHLDNPHCSHGGFKASTAAPGVRSCEAVRRPGKRDSRQAILFSQNTHGRLRARWKPVCSEGRLACGS